MEDQTGQIKIYIINKMSAQYREGKKPIPTDYKSNYDQFEQTCPGQCTCNFGERTNYDKIQYSYYVKHHPENLITVKEIKGWD